jgi:hypothetical protein
MVWFAEKIIGGIEHISIIKNVNDIEREKL